jgi:hypothetical protein
MNINVISPQDYLLSNPRDGFHGTDTIELW